MSTVDPATVSPAGVIAAMEAAGFTVYSRQPRYARMQWPAGTAAAGTPSMLVPLDTTAPDFARMMTAVLTTLRGVALAGAASSAVLYSINTAGDQE